MLKIDMHAHILPESWPDLGKKYGVPGMPALTHDGDRTVITIDGKFFREVWENIWNPEKRIEEYAGFGIDVQVVSTVPVLFNYHADPAHTLELAQFLNDHVASLQDRYPRHIIGLGTLPMQDTELAIEELRRLQALGIPGVQIGSNINDENLEEPRFFPIFEAASDLGMAIMVHPWQMMGRHSMTRYWLPWLVGMPAEVSRAICSLIFGGVMERLPKLRWCFAHGGGAFPFTVGRIEHGFNMRPDLVAVDNPVNPREYIGRFWIDSITHDSRALSYLLEVIGEDKIMMGTDYPFPLGEQEPGNVIGQLGLSESSREKLFCDNTLAWLDLDKERFT